MLPRRKAQQDSAEKADQVYRYQVREAEKSPVVLMYNVKQNMLLDKQVNFLERSKKMVVNRITVNQKVMFTHYRRRLNAAKLMHARIKGDIEMQQDLREQMLYGGRYGLTNEDEDVLRRIWKSRSQSFCADQDSSNIRGSRDTTIGKSQESMADMSKSTIKFQTPRRSSSCISIPDMEKQIETQKMNSNRQKISGRIKPTSAITPRHSQQHRNSLNRSKSAVPVIKVVDPEGEEEDMVDFDEVDHDESLQDQLKLHLPDINNADKQNADFNRKETIEQPRHHNRRRNSRANIFIKKKIQDMKTEHLKTEPPDSGRSVFDDADKGPSLLDVHKKKLEQSDVMQRVHTLLDSMAQFSKDGSLIDRDYYTHSVEQSAKAGWGTKKRADSIFSRISEHERRRAEGNPGVISMTVKPVRAKTAGAPKPRVKFLSYA